MDNEQLHPLTLTVEQAAQLLGIGRSTAYELVHTGDIPSLRLGRRIVVPVAHLAESLGVDHDAVWDSLCAEAEPPLGPSRGAPPKASSARRRSSSTVEAPTLF